MELGVMKPARGAKLHGIEAARGVAAVLVVLLHVGSILASPKQHGELVFGGFFLFGRAGVDFFFVLSGFIISHVHANDVGQPGRFLPYWRKRLWRIFPIYWVVTLGYQALLFVSPTQLRAEQDWVHVLASWALFPEAAAPILEVGWSLRHEMLFYALFGLSLLNRTLGRVVLAAWGLGIAWNVAVTLATGAPWFTGAWQIVAFRVFNLEFFFGIAAAAALRRGVWRPGSLAALGIALFLVNGVLESWGPRVPGEWPPRHVAYAVTAALAIYGLAGLDIGGRGMAPGWLVRLGTASYSIYLIHVPVAVVLAYAIRPGVARSRWRPPMPPSWGARCWAAWR